jgi:hypothetical protein
MKLKSLGWNARPIKRKLIRGWTTGRHVITDPVRYTHNNWDAYAGVKPYFIIATYEFKQWE